MTCRISWPRRSRPHGAGTLGSVTMTVRAAPETTPRLAVPGLASQHRTALGEPAQVRPPAIGASGRELGPALRPASGEDRPSAAGSHADPEPVGLLSLAVVRLERLLHGVASFDPDSWASRGART